MPDPTELKRIVGDITFDRPVLGLIVRGDDLAPAIFDSQYAAARCLKKDAHWSYPERRVTTSWNGVKIGGP